MSRGLLPDRSFNGRQDRGWLTEHARRLQSDVNQGEPSAVKRYYAVYGRGEIGQRCEDFFYEMALHVIAKELGYTSWEHLLEENP